MFDSKLNEIYKAQLTQEEFDKLSRFIYKESGIKMPPVKRVMLQSRLQKRLRELNLTSFKDYCDYVFSKDGFNNEIIHMLDVVSTNKTDFFREPVHFDFLTSNVLPEFYSKTSGPKQIKVWSAGCSSGEEPYTIAIVLADFAEKNPAFDYSIIGTDISTQILQKAVDAIYKEDRVSIIPIETKRKYFLRSKDRTNPTVKVASHIRKKVRFGRLNFMDATYDVPETFDVVFCRNVLIYFDRETQERVIDKLCSKLRSGGYFFLGHSESIMNMNLPLRQIKPTIFQRI
ncbi:MAG TPA: CheR family methyltransferase [Tenuifilaceae bacterium]|nr:CheR family methyltransferase [Tenuifilaceae bacterium]HPE17139.1 CheR family methyltransferase [Tenuifilaceae bacterium]HPJ45867.1 CheR family methyltransferase [Tenuifilaceae bacterium]HPQ34102.1 CheR family methyltransferase [Tenuifilaceae bacterium]HRX68727.1 CheR family methyltransferase [Tenuifilaceae bacterium]